MTAPEVTIMESIQTKLDKQFPNLLSSALDEFKDLHEDILDSHHASQVFYGWLFQDFCLSDGKDIPALCFEALVLDDTEQRLLRNIQQGIHGFFEVLGNKGKMLYVQDLLTKKDYTVATIDLDPLPTKGTCLETSLVKNLAGDYFLFGGFFYRDTQEGIRLNLLEYTRDLTIDETVAREIGIITRMKTAGQKDMLVSYLVDVLEFDKKYIRRFFQASDKEQETMIRESVIETIRADMEDDKGNGA